MMPRTLLPSNPARSSNPRKIGGDVGISQSAVLRYKVGIIRNGKRRWVTGWKNNLILDTGLNKIGNGGANGRWAGCIGACLFGNNVSPVNVRRDSGATTISQTGNTLTASSAFFLASDVGRLIKNNVTGEERYITVYTNSTTVTVGGPSVSIAANPATIWYVNETALTTLHSSTSTYGTNGGDNGSSVSGNVITFKRTFVGAAVGAPVTLTEIGFSDSTSNSNLFDRDLINPTVSLLTGDQAVAVVQLFVTFSPNTSTASPNVGTGCDLSGNMIISGLYNYITQIATNGNEQNFNQAWDMNTTGILGSASISTATFTLAAFNSNAGPTLPTITGASSRVANSYSAGTYRRSVTFSWNISSFNGTCYGFVIGSGQTFQLKFTNPFTKSSAQVLTITAYVSWGRTLVN